MQKTRFSSFLKFTQVFKRKRFSQKLDYIPMFSGKVGGKSEKNQGRRVVLDMVDKFKETGRRVFFDNFFTSVPLCEDLLKIGFTSVGTLRANKREIPDEFLMYKKKKIDVHRDVGSCLQAYHDSIMLTSWIPKVGKNILLLSSDPDAMENETIENTNKNDVIQLNESTASRSKNSVRNAGVNRSSVGSIMKAKVRLVLMCVE